MTHWRRGGQFAGPGDTHVPVLVESGAQSSASGCRHGGPPPKSEGVPLSWLWPPRSPAYWGRVHGPMHSAPADVAFGSARLV